MIPDLGKYAGAVIGSYVATIALIAGLIALSLWQSRRVKAALRAVEDRQTKTEAE
jgi:heme exporter protein D